MILLNNKLVSSKASKKYFQYQYQVHTVPTTTLRRFSNNDNPIKSEDLILEQHKIEEKFLPVIVKNKKKTSAFNSKTIKKKNISVLEEERLLNEDNEEDFSYTYTYTYDYKWLNQYLK